jgi:CHAD domain-containing protein
MSQVTKTGTLKPATVRFRMTRELHSPLRIPTPASIREVRQFSRRTLVRLRALRPILGRGTFRGLRRSLVDLLDSTSESRDAEVQRQVVARLKAEHSKRGRRDYSLLLRKLDSRKRAATVELADYLCSSSGVGNLRQLNEDLTSLEIAQSNANLPPLAARRYRRAVHVIGKRLAVDITMSHRVHALRIRIRRARALASMFDRPAGHAANHLSRELGRMQEALGDLRDSMLLGRWIRGRGLVLAPHLKARLDEWTRNCLKRCKRHRKALGPAIRQFLRQTRQ